MPELILLSTPIGDRGHLSDNAKALLRESIFFLAEDTRKLMHLLRSLNIDSSVKNIRSFHDYSRLSVDRAVEWIQEKKRAILVSDAGSPVICDPGFPLVRACHEHGISVRSCPGPGPIITALELSGLPPVPFHFHGFLPRNLGPLEDILERTLHTKGTHIFFESPKRVLRSVDALVGQGPIEHLVLARELTKEHEEILFATKTTWPHLRHEITLKGEFVILYHIDQEEGPTHRTMVSMAHDLLESPSPRKLSQILASILGEDTKEVYRRLQQKKKGI